MLESVRYCLDCAMSHEAFQCKRHLLHIAHPPSSCSSRSSPPVLKSCPCSQFQCLKLQHTPLQYCKIQPYCCSMYCTLSARLHVYTGKCHDVTTQRSAPSRCHRGRQVTAATAAVRSPKTDSLGALRHRLGKHSNNMQADPCKKQTAEIVNFKHKQLIPCWQEGTCIGRSLMHTMLMQW